MENAAIIRQLAQGIASTLLLFIKDANVEDSYIEVVRNEISEFRKLYIEWVNTFEQDEFTDKWDWLSGESLMGRNEIILQMGKLS